MRSLRSLVVLASMVAAFAVPASAFHSSNLPVLAASTLTSSGGVAYRVTVPEGASVDIEAFATSPTATGAVAAVYLLTGEGALRAALSVTVAGPTPVVRAEIPVAGTVVDQRSSGGGGGAGGALTATLRAGEYIVVGAGAADADVSTQITLRGSSGVVVLGQRSGRGFFYREAGFSRGAGVIVGTGTVAQAKVLAGVSATEHVAHRLFGMFSANLFDAASSLSYTGPDGGRSGSPSGYFYFGSPAGTYRFTIDANAAATSLQAIWSWGIDIQLP